MTRSSSIPTLRMLPLVVFGLFLLALVAAGVALARSMREGAERRGEAELVAVAELKLEDLAEHRAAILHHAALASSYPTLRRIAAGSLVGPVDPDILDHARDLVRGLAERYGLERIALLGMDGRALVDWVHPGAGPGGAFDPVLARHTLAQGAAHSTLFARPEEGRPRMDGMVPVPGPGAFAGVIAVRVDLTATLTALTDRWPVPSTTRRTVLARRDGDAAIFITDPIGRPGAALRQRIPLTDTSRGVVQAVLEPDRIFKAEDYRGTRLLLVVRRVPDSDWILFTRMELAEMEAPILGPAKAIALILASVILAGAIALGLWWRREVAQHRALEGAREELAASEERLRLALEGTLHVWDFDLSAGRLRFDERWAETTGRSAVVEGTLPEVLARLVHPDDVPAVHARFAALVEGEAHELDSEHRVLAGDGEVRWVQLRGRASARGPDGQALRATGVLADVTRERALKAQLARSERMASLGTLAAGVAHEVNNPLSYVLEATGMLAAALPAVAPGRPDLAEAAQHARDGVERIRDVVRSLRSFSRPGGTGRGPVDVREELEAAVRLAAHEIRHRAELVVSMAPMPRVAAGPHELGQLFLNLLVNAAHAMPEDGARPRRIEVTAGTDEAGWVRVEVTDTGVGIPPEVLARIFEPFFSTKPAGVGTGLGLAIAQGVAAAAGGRIEVESEVGKGSRFRVLLPPAPAAELADATAAASAAAPAGARAPAAPIAFRPEADAAAAARARVLVVDDEPLVARAIARALAPIADVTVSASAEEALVRLTGGERFDAVVCDLMMPGLSGMDLHEQVAALDAGQAARFVFVTGGAVTERARAFVAASGDRCVEKPFEPAVLRATVERTARAALA